MRRPRCFQLDKITSNARRSILTYATVSYVGKYSVLMLNFFIEKLLLLLFILFLFTLPLLFIEKQRKTKISVETGHVCAHWFSLVNACYETYV